MCYTGKCPYEDQLGDCRLRLKGDEPYPANAGCMEQYKSDEVSQTEVDNDEEESDSESPNGVESGTVPF
jgi:hypothetical protein